MMLMQQACLRPRDRFWDIPVPKIDSAFDNLLVPQPSWSPSTTQQLRKLVAAPYLPPNDWTPRLDAYFASPLALCARRVSSAASRLPRGYWGLPAFASLSMAGSGCGGFQHQGKTDLQKILRFSDVSGRGNRFVSCTCCFTRA
ncbi:hypothetical protein [Thiolapillus sp.]|uniref:hypothetical protein n=1 Tax=Thiolapillus sp. TaxID=2017437 RepID=UPI003AF7393B